MPHGGRHLFWVDSFVSLIMSTANGDVESLMTGLSSTESRMGLTLMRSILCLEVGRLIPDSGEGNDIVDIGIGIASQEAFAANVLSDPNVITEFPIGGWIFRCRVRTFGFAADASVAYSRVIERDLRNKRKINNGEMFITGFNTANQGSASTCSVDGIVRNLYLST